MLTASTPRWDSISRRMWAVVVFPEEVGPAIERALTRPEALMAEIRAYTMYHEPHRDCRCSARVLDAVDDFLAKGRVGLKRKPLNLVRKWKLRRQMHYWPFWERLRGR